MNKHEALNDLQSRSIENITDVFWLTEYLRPHCRIRAIKKRSTSLRILQIPSEFASFLVFMAHHKCKSYFEIGVSTGGSWFFAHQYLTATVDGFTHSQAIDIRECVRGGDMFFKTFPNATFTSMNSKRLTLTSEQFDMSFIDAFHKKGCVIRDFEKVRGNSRFVAFHDIALAASTVPDAWSEIKLEHKEHWEFIDYSIPEHARCGIGIVKV